MFGLKKKRNETNIDLIDKLPNKEKKQANKIIANAKRSSDPPLTAQDTIPIERAFKNGIVKVKDDYYSLTIAFEDINYDLSDDDVQAQIFEDYSNLINHFDSSINFQLSFPNLNLPKKVIENQIRIDPRTDSFTSYRNELEKILRLKFSAGNSSLSKEKYLTIGIHADSIKQAQDRFQTYYRGIYSILNTMNVKARILSMKERAKLMSNILNIGKDTIFNFNWDKMIEAGVSIKDKIAPDGINFCGSDHFMLGNTYASIQLVSLDATEITDKFLSDLFSIDHEQVVSIHAHSLDQRKAIKIVRTKITEIDSAKIKEQKRAVRGGYDMDILPTTLVNYSNEAYEYLSRLESQNERSFMITFTIMVTGSSKEELDNNILSVKSLVQESNNELRALSWQQEQGLVSILPLAYNEVEIERMVPTSGLSIMIPFKAQELTNIKNKNAFYYGLNTETGNFISCDRHSLAAPTAVILGKTGAGKSMQEKTELIQVMLKTDDNCILVDPDGEAAPLIAAFKGQEIELSPDSSTYINPFDISINYGLDENIGDLSKKEALERAIKRKKTFMLSFVELALSDREDKRLSSSQRSIIDFATEVIYRDYKENPVRENIPTLTHMYNALLTNKEILEMDAAIAKELATALRIYVEGSLDFFNHKTNVDINNRLVSFNLVKLDKQIRPLGMLIVEDFIWTSLAESRASGTFTRLYIDEAHELLKDEKTAEFSVDIYKKIRKWNGLPTFITQNVTDFLKSPAIEAIIKNTHFFIMLRQSSSDADVLQEQLQLSERQTLYIKNAERGAGLLKFGDVIVPFSNQFPSNTKLYRLMTTSPEDLIKMRKK